MAAEILLITKPCKNDPSEVITLLLKYTKILYGLNTDNLPDELWEAVFDAICNRFPGIQMHDIQTAFRYATIEKKEYKSLSRDEMIEPIQKYWVKKLMLINELKYFENLSKEEAAAINKDREFKENAKRKYIECIETGIWNGDEFEADAIARNFKNVFKQDKKDEIMVLAKQEYMKRTEQAKDNVFEKTGIYSSVPGWQKIFSRIYIEECLKIRYKFITD